MHPTTTTLASVVAIVTLLANIALSYFAIPNTLACDLAAVSPATQQAAAAIMAR